MNVQTLRRVFSLLEDDYGDGLTFRQKLAAYVTARVHRADVVAELPLNEGAPAGYLMVTPGDPYVYVGTGAGNPLRRIATEATP